MKPSGSRSKVRHQYQKAAVNKLGGRVIDRRTTLGRALGALARRPGRRPSNRSFAAIRGDGREAGLLALQRALSSRPVR